MYEYVVWEISFRVSGVYHTTTDSGTHLTSAEVIAAFWSRTIGTCMQIRPHLHFLARINASQITKSINQPQQQ